MSVFKNIEQKPCKHRAFVFFNIHARACDANLGREDARASQGYEYEDANAISHTELLFLRVYGYDVHRYVYGNGYVPLQHECADVYEKTHW